MLQQVFDAAEDVGLPVTFTLPTGNSRRSALARRDHDGREVQFGRHPDGDYHSANVPPPIGLVIGLELTGNPFVFYPSYQEIADLPLAERVAEMRKPEVRARILADKPAGGGHPLLYLAQAWDWIFPLDDNADYEPDRVDFHRWRGRMRAVSARWKRHTIGSSTTTATPCCSSRWPISRTTRWTPSAS